MSIQRYDLRMGLDAKDLYMDTMPDGEYVTFTDHAAAIRTCQESCLAVGYEQGRKDAATVRPLWVPCSESKPEYEKTVLCTTQGRVWMGCYYKACPPDTFSGLEFLAHRYTDHWELYDSPGGAAAVTAWMPLPTVPGEGT